MRSSRASNPVRFADENISILAALTLIGVDLPPGAGERAVKIRCPFGELHHADGGIDPAMRIYPDRVHCFAGCGTFRPVGLVAHAFDITRRQAASELIERTGCQLPARYNVWTDHDDETAPDTARLAEALKTFCRRMCAEWHTRQFEPTISGQLSRCLSLLSFVHDEAAAQRWLEACKRVMALYLVDHEWSEIDQH